MLSSFLHFLHEIIVLFLIILDNLSCNKQHFSKFSSKYVIMSIFCKKKLICPSDILNFTLDYVFILMFLWYLSFNFRFWVWKFWGFFMQLWTQDFKLALFLGKTCIAGTQWIGQCLYIYIQWFKKTCFSGVERPILKLGLPNSRWSFHFFITKKYFF